METHETRMVRRGAEWKYYPLLWKQKEKELNVLKSGMTRLEVSKVLEVSQLS